MLVRKTREQRAYLLKLKSEIIAFLENFKKRYQLFPWTQVNRLKKFNLNSSSPITVNGTSFTVMELVKEIRRTKTKIQSKMKPSSYNYILRAYIRDSMNKTGDELTEIYNIYDEQLQVSFKETKQNLEFCLDALKVLNKTFKTENSSIKESYDDLLTEGTESEKYTYSKSFKDVQSIADSLNKTDLLRICNGTFKKSPFRKRLFTNPLYETVNSVDRNTYKESRCDREMYNNFLENGETYTEGFKFGVPFKVLYHASRGLFDELRPVGIDFGNSFQTAGWSLFAWTKHDSAMGWGCWEVFRRLKALDDRVNLNGCLNSQTTVLEQSVYDYIKDNIHKYSEEDLTFYVYSIPTKSEYEYGLGHSSNTPNCITIRTDPIKYSKVDKHIMDISMVNKYCKIVPDGYEPTDKEYGKNRRLLSFFMKYDFMYQTKLKKIIKEAIDNGELHEGDDLRTFCNDNNINIKQVSFKERMRDIIKHATESGSTLENDETYMEGFKENIKKRIAYNKKLKDYRYAIEDPDDKEKQIFDELKAEFKKKETKLISALKKVYNDFTNDYGVDAKSIVHFVKKNEDYQYLEDNLSSNAYGLTKLELIYTNYYLEYDLCDSRLDRSALEDNEVLFDEFTDALEDAVELVDRRFKLAIDGDWDSGLIGVKISKIISFKDYKESEELTMLNWYDYVTENGEYIDLRNAVLEAYEYMESFDDEDEDELTTEGANIESKKVYKEYRKKVKKCSKDYKKHLKNGEYDEARKDVQNMEKLLKDCESLIRSTASTTGSMVFGFIISLVKWYATSLLLMLVPIGVTFGGAFGIKNDIASQITVASGGIGTGLGSVAVAVNTVRTIINQIVMIAENVKKGESTTEDIANAYKNDLLTLVKKLQKSTKKLYKIIDTNESKEKKLNKTYNKKIKSIKESVDFISSKHALYEACAAGEITVEEREELFGELQEKYYVENRTTDVMYDTGASNREKFNSVRTVLYERCSAGEITVEERESLISKAYDMLLSESEENTDSVNGTPASVKDSKKVNADIEKTAKDESKNMEKNLDKEVK